MTDLERLLAIEDIRMLMARRVRCLDEKDWEGFGACYAEDAIASFSGQPDGSKGRQQVIDNTRGALENVATAHQVHSYEIEFQADDEATGIWALFDILSWDAGDTTQWMRGYGHYRQKYRKIDGQWLITAHELTRLLLETGED